MTADEKYQAAQQRLGYQLDEFKIGGNYTPLVRDAHHLYISGQIPGLATRSCCLAKSAKA